MITGLVLGGVAVTAAGALAGYQAMDHGQSAEVLNVEPLTRAVRTPRTVCSDVIGSHQATTGAVTCRCARSAEHWQGGAFGGNMNALKIAALALIVAGVGAIAIGAALLLFGGRTR